MSGLGRCIVLIGAPGVGKGTFAKIISAQTGWKHLSVGDLLRKEVKDKSAIGLQIDSVLRSGGLVSDALASQVADKHMDIINAAHQPDSASNNSFGRAVLLDGYPRTLPQALHLTQRASLSSGSQPHRASQSSRVTAVQIVLEPWVAIKKLLHREQCVTCGEWYNSAHIMEDGFDMPAVLPIASTCSLGPQKCKPVIHRRNDDTEDVISKRMQEYDIKTAPIVEYYRSRNELVTFHVRKGVKDSPQLLQLILSAAASSN